MNDNDIHRHIEELVAEEHRLLDRAEGSALSAEQTDRLKQVEVQLDRYFDLLRQRRAREEFGQNPESSKMRSAETVERYLQ